MRFHQLNEYSRQVTATNLGSALIKSASVDDTILVDVESDDAIDQILSKLESADPTKNKKFSQWIARTYAKGGFKFEDVGSTVSDRLEKYETLKTRKKIDSTKADINVFKDFISFLDYVDSLSEPEKKEPVSKGNFEITYEDEYCTVIWPKDEAASKYFGRGTRWCTAADNNNFFNIYNERGGLRILLPKKNVRTRPNEKYQFFMKLWQTRDQGGKIHANINLNIAAENDVEEDDVDADLVPEYFYGAYSVISNQLLKNKLPSIYSGYNEITIKDRLYGTEDKYKLNRSNDWRAYSNDDIQSIIIDQLEKSNLSEDKAILNEADFKQIYVMLTPALETDREIKEIFDQARIVAQQDYVNFLKQIIWNVGSYLRYVLAADAQEPGSANYNLQYSLTEKMDDPSEEEFSKFYSQFNHHMDLGNDESPEKVNARWNVNNNIRHTPGQDPHRRMNYNAVDQTVNSFRNRKARNAEINEFVRIFMWAHKQYNTKDYSKYLNLSFQAPHVTITENQQRTNKALYDNSSNYDKLVDYLTQNGTPVTYTPPGQDSSKKYFKMNEPITVLKNNIRLEALQRGGESLVWIRFNDGGINKFRKKIVDLIGPIHDHTTGFKPHMFLGRISMPTVDLDPIEKTYYDKKYSAAKLPTYGTSPDREPSIVDTTLTRIINSLFNTRQPLPYNRALTISTQLLGLFKNRNKFAEYANTMLKNSLSKVLDSGRIDNLELEYVGISRASTYSKSVDQKTALKSKKEPIKHWPLVTKIQKTKTITLPNGTTKEVPEKAEIKIFKDKDGNPVYIRAYTKSDAQEIMNNSPEYANIPNLQVGGDALDDDEDKIKIQQRHDTAPISDIIHDNYSESDIISLKKKKIKIKVTDFSGRGGEKLPTTFRPVGRILPGSRYAQKFLPDSIGKNIWLPEYVEFQGKEIKTQKVRVAPEQYGQPYSLYGQTITVTNPTTNDEYRYNFFKGWEKVQTEAIKEDVSKTINYVQFRLSKESRQELMNVYPGVYSKQLLKHITLAYDVDPTKFEQYKKKWNDESFIATGIINGNGVDMFTVTCGNKNIRPDGNYYHITASVEPPIKPEESKVFIKQRRGHPHTKIKPISLTGEIVLSTIKSKLTEDAQQPKVYVDMDGVIADFKTQFAKYDYDISKLANTDPKTIKSLFANLKPLYDGVKLLQWLTRNKVDFTILSAPLRPGSKTDDSGSNASKIGKHEWLSKNVPGKEKTAIFTSNKHKYANNSILIDDSSRYIDKWTEAGGIGILHTDYESTISKLEKILNKQNTLP